jgi:hypothetical protein
MESRRLSRLKLDYHLWDDIIYKIESQYYDTNTARRLILIVLVSRYCITIIDTVDNPENDPDEIQTTQKRTRKKGRPCYVTLPARNSSDRGGKRSLYDLPYVHGTVLRVLACSGYECSQHHPAFI